MPQLNFPASPNHLQEYTSGTLTFVYDSDAGKWNRSIPTYFLRSDEDDTMNGNLTIADSVAPARIDRLGSTGDMISLRKDGVQKGTLGVDTSDALVFEADAGYFKLRSSGNTSLQVEDTRNRSNVPLYFSSSVGNTFMEVEGATDDLNEVSFVVTDPTADRTITFLDATGTVVLDTSTQTLTNKTLTAPTITGTVIEDVYALSGTTPALEPANGSIQTWTLSDSSTPTDSLAAGEAITLMIDDGSAFTVTWPTMTWVNNGGAAPTLATTGYTVIALWKVSTTLYGALVGDGT